MSFTISTSITINATPEKVWNVFTDFNSYPEWNPLMIKLEGEVKEGNTIFVDLGTMSFKPKVLSFENEKELIWKGKLFIPGLFDGKHQFIFNDNGDGTTTLTHSEEFKGLLLPLLKKKMETETKSKFEEFNIALKERVE